MKQNLTRGNRGKDLYLKRIEHIFKNMARALGGYDCELSSSNDDHIGYNSVENLVYDEDHPISEENRKENSSDILHSPKNVKDQSNKLQIQSLTPMSHPTVTVGDIH